MPFTTRITVRFGDCDPAGLVYYPVIFHYCHVALEEFFAARCGVPYDRLMRDERLGFPTVNVRAEFFAPLVYGDEAEVVVAVARLGRSSVTLQYEVSRAGDRTLCARSEQVHAAMNLDARRAVEISARLREAFSGAAQ
jgi:4-hydroxybenzoyl-CoA thioesterase